MEKIVIWGTGEFSQKLINNFEDYIVMIVDSDEKKWGTMWNGHCIYNPIEIIKRQVAFDRIVIATTYWKEIKEQIQRTLNISPEKIDNVYYRQRQRILVEWADEKDLEKQEYYAYIRSNPLEVFNADFSRKYDECDVKVYFDNEKRLFYVEHAGRKMYFSRTYKQENKVRRYYQNLLREQDEKSPHRYITENFCVKQGDIVLDAGVAEGNFALEVIDLVEKIYLIETDAEWIEALRYTFEPYMDKVEIIEGFLGDGEDEVSIDEIIKNSKLDFVKLDIEGAEVRALQGAKNTLINNHLRLDVCTYHNENDEEQIRQILEDYGYKCDVSQGYMVFVTSECLKKEVECPKLVRGLVRGYKE